LDKRTNHVAHIGLIGSVRVRVRVRVKGKTLESYQIGNADGITELNIPFGPGPTGVLDIFSYA
jgi:hypothetical protein